MRTTLDLDKSVLDGLKAIQKKDKRSLGRIASELLADALSARRNSSTPCPVKFAWNRVPMGARVDLGNKDSLNAILDEDAG